MLSKKNPQVVQLQCKLIIVNDDLLTLRSSFFYPFQHSVDQCPHTIYYHVLFYLFSFNNLSFIGIGAELQLILALDSSDSVSEDLFNNYKKLAKNIVSLYQLVPSKKNSVVISSVGKDFTTETPSAQSIPSIQSAIDGLSRAGETADYSNALEGLLRSLENKNIPAHLVLLTSWNDTESSKVSQEFKNLADKYLKEKSTKFNVINVQDGGKGSGDGGKDAENIDDLVINVIDMKSVPAVLPVIEKQTVNALGTYMTSMFHNLSYIHQ